jgi:hypothetical protein
MSGWSLSFTAEESVLFERCETGAGERIIKVWHRVAVSGPGNRALSKGCTLARGIRRGSFEVITFTYESRSLLD